MVSASAGLVSSGLLSSQNSFATEFAQLPDNVPKLTPEGQAEADARYQLVLSRNGSHLTEEEKSTVKMACVFVQPGLQRLRAYPLKNGDLPALFLKPIVSGRNQRALNNLEACHWLHRRNLEEHECWELLFYINR